MLVSLAITAASLVLAQANAAASPTPSPSSFPSPIAQHPDDNWNLTVYYTAVESYHHGFKVLIRGCRTMGCDRKESLGSYPNDFTRAVKSEGTGRITSGNYAGKYLCWSEHSGYWIDDVPKNAEGDALVPWVSAAADADVLNYGVVFRVIACGKDDTDGSDIAPAVCERIKSSHWKIMDRFEADLGGKRHIDLYIGEEDQNDFVQKSPKEISVKSASISLDLTL